MRRPGADTGMDTNETSSLPAPDSGPDDAVLGRLLRAVAAPLRARPAPEVRRAHVSAASIASRGPAAAPSGARASRRRSRVLRPVLAGGLTLALVAGLVTAVTVGIPGASFERDDAVQLEFAMAPGFIPSPAPVERTEDHVILTVDAGRAAQLTDELVQLLGSDPAVLSVRSDRTSFTVPASIAAQLELAGVEAVADTPMGTLATPVTQSPVPSWGLDRIDAITDPLDGSYRFVSTGAGVRVYVIDTGVRSDHADLAGRVIPGWSAYDDGRGSEDCNGHGTHVAGTVAGSAFGVAKGATIVAIRVLDCDGAGFASSVVSGISWAIANHPGGPGVINLSLGGPANSAIDRAVADATARGLVVVAAAGNEGGDACAVSPARAASAVTTGATTSRDARASYSNFGGCVDLFAPGSGITSAWHTGSGASATLSGTSMAAPHVAGIAARLLQADPGAGPSRIADLLTGSAKSGAVDDTNGSPNLLVNLVDFKAIDCGALIDEGIEEGDEIPEECLEEYCEMLEQDGAELPEECLDDDEDGDEDGRDGEGRPDSPPGLSGQLPPGFGGAVPGLERAPGLDGRVPPGLTDGGPPGLVRDVPRVNGLSIVRDGSALLAGWRAPEGAASYVLECSAQRPPTWSTDLALTIAAGSVVRDGDRVSVTLPAAVDGYARCRVAAELEGVLGLRSNAANVPAATDESDDAPAEGEGSGTNVPGQPSAPGQGNAPSVPGPGNAPGAAPGTPSQGGPSITPGPPNAGGRTSGIPFTGPQPSAPATGNSASAGDSGGNGAANPGGGRPALLPRPPRR